MHVNFGLFTPLEEKRLNKKQRYAAYAKRAQQDMERYVDSRPELFGRWRGSWPEGKDFA
jgi:methylenetetrahydrofolate--tRNA-(uracil-5-)-methyltransferase